jgi:hypothetical protein
VLKNNIRLIYQQMADISQISQTSENIFFFSKNEGDPTPHTVSEIAQLNTFILGISAACSIMLRGFSHSCKRTLICSNWRSAQALGCHFVQRDTQNYRHFVQRDTQNYRHFVQRDTELSPFCTETHRTIAILYRKTQRTIAILSRETHRTTAILYRETHRTIASLYRETHRTIAILYRDT